MPRLAVTRTSGQLSDLKSRAATRGIEVLPLPLIAIHDIPFDWPHSIPIDKVDWVFFTSANGVTSFLNRLDDLNLRLPYTTRLAVVGTKTAQALEQNGRQVSFIPSDAYGQLLFEEFDDHELRPGQILIYARGREINYDPELLFSERPVTYAGIVCYETIAQPVIESDVRRLTEDDFILFTAPSTVDSYARQYGRPIAKPIAIGRSTAAQMNQYGWFGFITMKSSDIDTILEYL